MNTYNGEFSQDEVDQLDRLVDGWIFWYDWGEYFAKNPSTPDKRFRSDSVFDLCMQITTAKSIGYFG